MIARRIRIAVTCTALTALSACANATLPNSSPSQDATSAAAYAHDVFVAVNAERTVASLTPLEWDDCLAEEALKRARQAAGTDELQHEALLVSCGDGERTGENLSRLNGTPAEVVERWMASAGHEANIMDADFSVGGVGCVEAGSLTTCSMLEQ
ncbi:CAP domain-containing protein [Demequina sediminicola]|uniref:CAP domain-containing protein n=1 Tax=Demequina sediminicola TaxID=1095026 RepID=UPI0007859225|nr:CAP domain-containing protein [Demequina sediminicola]